MKKTKVTMKKTILLLAVALFSSSSSIASINCPPGEMPICSVNLCFCDKL
ncbi:hypothetical protein VIAQ111709_00985 [Vibrio aquimaris]|uniref:Uncharacterized protein n=1 Tax=Vibrio aquimaris TaxID=2587862 RepID=A0A5P9CMX3_9VIBR|nr:hypothetical protein FIV01_11600 [Vibrio aquimaris]